MTSPSFKFRYVNEISGAFVLLALALLIAGIVTAGHAQRWFERKVVLQTAFPLSYGSFGLKKGAEVRMLDTVAGRVREVVPNEAGEIVVTFEIAGAFRKLVREDSVARAKKTFGVAGDAYVELAVGDRSRPVATPGRRVPFQKDTDLMESVQATLDGLKESLPKVLGKADEILTHVNNIVKSIDEGQGAAGRLINDPEVGAAVKRAALDLQRVTAGMPDQVAGVMGEAEQVLRDVDRLIEGIQKHWLVRGYIDHPTGTPMIPAYQLPPMPGGKP